MKGGSALASTVLGPPADVISPRDAEAPRKRPIEIAGLPRMGFTSAFTRYTASRGKPEGSLALTLFAAPQSALGQGPFPMRRRAPVPPTPAPDASSEREAEPAAIQPSRLTSNSPFV